MARRILPFSSPKRCLQLFPSTPICGLSLAAPTERAMGRAIATRHRSSPHLGRLVNSWANSAMRKGAASTSSFTATELLSFGAETDRRGGSCLPEGLCKSGIAVFRKLGISLHETEHSYTWRLHIYSTWTRPYLRRVRRPNHLLSPLRPAAKGYIRRDSRDRLPKLDVDYSTCRDEST